MVLLFNKLTLYNQLQCFGTYNDTKYTKTSLDQEWRLWQFQVCTQWGYFSVRVSFYVYGGMLIVEADRSA